jgi:hypothetical protein
VKKWSFHDGYVGSLLFSLVLSASFQAVGQGLVKLDSLIVNCQSEPACRQTGLSKARQLNMAINLVFGPPRCF